MKLQISLLILMFGLAQCQGGQEYWLEDGCHSGGSDEDCATVDGCMEMHPNNTPRWGNANDAVGEIHCCSDSGACTRMDGSGACISGDADAQKYTYFEAQEMCEAQSMRLCTKDELLTDSAAGCCASGCWHDYSVVWTSDMQAVAGNFDIESFVNQNKLEQGFIGLSMPEDNAYIALGEERDVKMWRDSEGRFKIGASEGIDFVSRGSVTVNGEPVSVGVSTDAFDSVQAEVNELKEALADLQNCCGGVGDDILVPGRDDIVVGGR